MAESKRLHIGSGRVRLEGWVNVDKSRLEGVDVALDVRLGLPWDDVEYIYCEHFIEHLEVGDAFRFLKECRRALRSDGVVRLSTPNLDWVMATQYHAADATGDDRVAACLAMNKAFHAWGHQFLYNRASLTRLLEDAGFREVEFFSYGESPRDDLRGLEHHEAYPDAPEHPHILIAEATGLAERSAGDSIPEWLEEYVMVTEWTPPPAVPTSFARRMARRLRRSVRSLLTD